eukprot:Blabericola_migrator_1__12911@NODE_847_length_6279_cov_125_778010_g599_i0_p3_GENE_NODE_847_length_6279_cov_125_778010_g599_i0NODE_847_length_6279_cov_125_778010_g599_i0_p3_ORF_typecomplete_len225_score38_15_NODE_847_length_6279_cov_125_778010_g599_i0263937
MKPFSHMYQEFLKDRRARVTLAHFCFDEDAFVPKTATWKSLPREMVGPLVHRRHWEKLGWMRHGAITGGPEEGFYWLPIMEEFGEGFAEMVHPGKMANSTEIWKPNDSTYFHLDCWYDSIPAECNKLGVDAKGLPRTFSRFNGSSLKTVLNYPHVWTLRKANDTSMVDDTPLPDWLFDFWNSPHNRSYVPHHPAMRDGLTPFKGATSIAAEAVRWKAQGVFGLK